MPRREILYGEKDQTFVQDMRIEGNLSVAKPTEDESLYGDGSLQVDGSLLVDNIRSATPGSFVQFSSPVNFTARYSAPSPPPSGQTQLYSDGSHGSRLLMVLPTGEVVDLNPIKKKGQLITKDEGIGTTMALPAGLPGDVLQIDPIQNPSSLLAWEGQYADVYYTDNSDALIRYMEVPLQPITFNDMSTQVIQYGTPYRVDPPELGVNPQSIQISADGNYHLSFQITFGWNEDLVSGNELVCVQIWLETSTTSTVTNLDGTTTMTTTPYVLYPGSRKSSLISATGANTMTFIRDSKFCQHLLSITNGTNVRMCVQAVSSLTDMEPGILKMVEGRVCIRKVNLYQTSIFSATGDDSREYVTDLSAIPIALTVVSDDNNNTVSNNSLDFATAGIRCIYGKATFGFDDTASPGAIAVVECMFTRNGNPIVGSESRGTLQYCGTVSQITIPMETVVSLATDDQIGMEIKVISMIGSGHVVTIAEDCKIDSLLVTTLIWESLVATNNAMIQMKQSAWTTIAAPTVDTNVSQLVGIGLQYVSRFNTIELMGGGTYRYSFKTTVENAGSSVGTLLVKVSVNRGLGFKEVLGSRFFVTLMPGEFKTVMTAGEIYVPPHSHLRFDGICLNGGDQAIRLMEGTTQIYADKIELTNSNFIGSTNFGRYYEYVEDVNDVQATSTDFSLRLAIITRSLPPGNYKVTLNFEWDMSSPGLGFETQLLLDNTTVVDTFTGIANDVGYYRKVVSSMTLNLPLGYHVLTFMTRVDDASRWVTTRRVRMEIFHV